MADQANEKPEATTSVADAQEALATENKVDQSESTSAEKEQSESEDKGPQDDIAMEETKETEEDKTIEKSDKAVESATETKDKPAEDDGDTEMKDAPDATAVENDDAAPADTPANKGKARRKSTAGESKAKTLSKKSSRARLTNLDAKPGDHFLVKLKGFPAWPAIVCDESMLPAALVNSRPVTAARPDGTFSEAYADGGKRVNDRNFPVMYLHTNEFGWVINTALSALSPEKAAESITDKMRKDLKEAFSLAAENHSIEYYKEILKNFQEEMIAQEEARREAAATPKKSKKGKAKATDDDDVDMDDVDDKSKAKKRKADEEVSTPQRSDPVKKPKIKLNTSSTPKTNGATPKSKDESTAKKAKAKKPNEKKGDASKEPKMTPEERHARKEKEVLYLRHRLQRGLLTRDQQPQEGEMKSMSEYITMLENFKDLEVSIIRATKINKVLKAILKLESIPKEDEFNFKKRSQTLLDKWNKLLASDGTPVPVATNGVNGTSESKSEKKSEESGTKGDAEGAKDKSNSAEPTPDVPAEEDRVKTAEAEKSVKTAA